MSNPLYNSTNNQQNPFAQIIKQARDFRKQFTGNPRYEVQRLLNTGAMSQNEFNRLSQIAQQIVQAMGDDV